MRLATPTRQDLQKTPRLLSRRVTRPSRRCRPLTRSCVDAVGPTAEVERTEEYEEKGEKKTRKIRERMYDLHGERSLLIAV